MNFHICSSCHLLFWKARCVLKVNWGGTEESSRCALLNGGWVGGGIAERRGRRGPLLQGSTQGRSQKKRNPNIHGGARYWPSIVLPRNGLIFFSFCYLFHWLYDVKMLFLSRVSCVLSWCESADVCICKALFLPLHRWHHAWRAWMFECVCIHVPTSGQCFVFIALLTRCKDQRAESGFFFSLDFLLEVWDYWNIRVLLLHMGFPPSYPTANNF